MKQFNEYKPVRNELSNKNHKVYSIHLYKSHYNPEMFELSRDYETNVHKRAVKDSGKQFFKEYMAMSPLYDPTNKQEAGKPSPWDDDIEPEVFEDESEHRSIEETLKANEVPYPPTPGSYHMYHRIDGELVAIGIIEITEKYFNSAYFMYKSKYAYLNLGVVGAIIELEYCQKLMDLWQPSLQYYHLGELVLDCPKVNYKLNF